MLLESEPYGYFSNTQELESAIRERLIKGHCPLGDAVIFLGGKIINDGRSIHLEEPVGDSQRLEVRVFPNGNYRMSFESDNIGDPPSTYQEIENP